MCGAPTSPVKHLRLIEPSDDRDIDERTLQKIVEMVSFAFLEFHWILKKKKLFYILIVYQMWRSLKID